MAATTQPQLPAAPGPVERDIAAIQRRLPPEKGTFQAGLFAGLVAALQANREGLVAPEEAWAAAGYTERYENAPFEATTLDGTINNLRALLRALHSEGKTKHLWAVERAPAGGYRLRVLAAGGTAYTGAWLLAPYDREVWEADKVVVFTGGAGWRPAPPAPWAKLAVVVGVVGVALWALNRPSPAEATRSQPRRLPPLGARIKGATCSSSLWDTGGRLPEDAWSRCSNAVDGVAVGLGVWVSDSEVGEEWIEVELAYSYPVWGVRVHFSDWPCLRTPAGERVCGEGTRPGKVVVDGRLAGEGWTRLATEVVVPATPWEPMDITFAETRVLHLRILAEPGATGRRHFLQLAEVVVNPPTVEEYPGPVPSPG